MTLMEFSRKLVVSSVVLVALLALLQLSTLSVEGKKIQFSPEQEQEWKNLQHVLPTMFGRMLGTASPAANPEDGVGGGSKCVGCTAVIALFEQYSSIHNKSVEEALDEVCGFLPSPVNQACYSFVSEFGLDIIALLESHETPDTVCNQIKFCSMPTCRLFPPNSDLSWNWEKTRPKTQSPRLEEWRRANPGKSRPGAVMKPDLDIDPWKWINDEINRIFNSHFPAIDDDNDTFSSIFPLRGSAFRGKDCDDTSPSIYPGRQLNELGPNVDHNCNGIYGTNGQGEAYEDLFCAGTDAMGIALLGDSAGAHFHIPVQWVTASMIQSDTFQDLINIAEVEFDWPWMSSATGYANSSWVGAPVGKVDSTYLRFRERNRCVHRDYQNMGVNGARSSAMRSTVMYSFRRNQKTDNPVILTYALIGNDVCNPHYGTSHMTTPQEFYENVVDALEYLDTRLPFGSHVVFLGLVDGRILFDVMGERIHPIGSYRNDVTYSQFYDYFNCLEVSPCFGWMNSNETWRNVTSERAAQLSEVYPQIIANHTYQHFDMTYFPCPLQQVFDLWVEQGGQAWELIEPVDGFHPTQISNALLAEYQFNLTLANYSYLLPPVNPNNNAIDALFGDQGGY